jgi:hypothetical protein
MATEGGKTLGVFLVELSEDDSALEEYHRDRHGFLDRADLAEEHKAALRAGDVRRIREALQREHGGGGAKPFFVIVYREAR